MPTVITTLRLFIFWKIPMPTVIRVPTLINFLENSHAYGNKGAYAYSEVKSTCLGFQNCIFLLQQLR